MSIPYQRGQRVALEHTTDPHTGLRPGDLGTVRDYHPDLQTVDVDWDTGSRLSMCLDAGDSLRIVDTTPSGAPAQPRTTAGWERLLEAARANGAATGHALAEGWAQDTIGGRATGNVKTRARRILAGLDDGDHAALDGLPATSPATATDDTAADRPERSDAAVTDSGEWPALTPRERDDLSDAYLDSAHQALLDRVAQLCRAVLSPTGDGRDLSHLHPGRLRPGSIGVFAGSWAWTPAEDGEMRVPLGFVGTFVDTWNGFAVFTCTRQVAEAIVADQDRMRREHHQVLLDSGSTPQIADQLVDTELPAMTFDGDAIIVDQRRYYDDPDAIERIEPDKAGQYVVMGRSWCWNAVDPYDCDRIVGDLPDPDNQQHLVTLTHTPDPRVPHDQLTVTAPHSPPTDTLPGPGRPHDGAPPHQLSVGDSAMNKTRVLSHECATCIFKPGNLMHLTPGRLQQMVTAARGDAGYIICHSTLPYAGSPVPPAICRGFADRYRTWQLQLIERVWGFVEVPPPDDGPATG